MVRTHTLVEYRLKEFELEQALRNLKKQQEELDYKLDVEFYHKLEELTERHGYSMTQVFDLLMSRYEGSAEQASGGAGDLNARTNTALLEMMQRLEPRHDPSPEDVDGMPKKSSTECSAKSKSNSEVYSKSDRNPAQKSGFYSLNGRGTEHDLNLATDVEDNDSKVGGKSHD
ncbi:hypothetical protein ACIQAL_19295 [Pseudomonas sp. NPDC088368]|uniref:hypothetical protein n=1 Tax=Pseudomonas sp. NPDC088368 TaxID=3364453 RepID=UPI003804169F